MLSAQQFDDIVALIQTTRPAEPNSVRRAERIIHRCALTITLGTSETPGPSYEVHVRDISPRGMCFFHTQDLRVGTVFVVKLEAVHGPCVSILSTIIHCKQLTSHTFQFGAEFTCALDETNIDHAEPLAEDLMRIRSTILD
jgi:hypothetical protein